MKRRLKPNIKFFIGLYIAKILSFFIGIFFKDRGTHIVGAIAIKICPDFLSRIGIPSTVIAVTGTNGKTSTSNLINDVLNNNGITTVNNSKGSNMPAGIASSLIKKCTLKGLIKESVAVFEVDERASAYIYDHIPPTYLICTNLFRDSIKRNGHAEFILTKIKSSVPQSTTLILNADDLISSSIGDKNKMIFFSLDKLDISSSNSLVCDAMVCPECKSKLEYDYIHYNHIGKSHCSKCNFKSPKSDFVGTNVDFKKNTFEIIENNKRIKYKMISDSVFNLYNTIGVIAVLRTYGLGHNQIRFGLENASIKTSRYDISKVGKLEVITMLSKNQNPISSSRALDYVSNVPGNKVVVLLLTDTKDKVHGSEDISWLYDTDFEYLNKDDVKQIIACGNRCYDLSLRLKLAGINPDIINTTVDYENIESLINKDGIDKIFILYELYGYPIAFNLKNKLGGIK
jgi:UDP-N-acetylmuramyl tripeptide synthase